MLVSAMILHCLFYDNFVSNLSHQSNDWLGISSLKWPILCQARRETGLGHAHKSNQISKQISTNLFCMADWPVVSPECHTGQAYSSTGRMTET